jgi:hypothetical protein
MHNLPQGFHRSFQLAAMFGPLPDGGCSSAGPRFITEDPGRSLGAFPGHPLLVVPQADAARTLDAQDMLGSMPQGAFAIR